MKRVGLIVNPIAGIGGRVGLKGSDGADIQKQAWKLGAVPVAAARTLLALEVLFDIREDFELLTAAGEMGAEIAREANLKSTSIGTIISGNTTARDTISTAKGLLNEQIDVLLFAGGDGTARDIFQAIGGQVPVIGIPAGVKIHSGVFATHPRQAGELCAQFIKNSSIILNEYEVIDLDEDAYRRGIITTRLYGYLKVPTHKRWIQNTKVPSPESEIVQMEAIAWDVVESMQPEWYYILGPGTTMRAIASQLGFEKTLVGVDIVARDQVIALDVNERQIIDLIQTKQTRIVITPIGGQGFLLGRGNQPISPGVIKYVGPENIQVVCTPGKLHSFVGRPLLVDTGDPHLDELFSGHISIITGYHEKAVYPISNSGEE
jgi:predicted polyphosphate/ATP-dependent NAD kinase